jgi:hypothetical protein
MARREESLSAVWEETEGAGGTALAIPADATDLTSVIRAFDEMRELKEGRTLTMGAIRKVGFIPNTLRYTAIPLYSDLQ